MAPSSRGLGHLPFTEATGVRIPLGLLKNQMRLHLVRSKLSSLGEFFLCNLEEAPRAQAETSPQEQNHPKADELKILTSPSSSRTKDTLLCKE